MKLFRPRLVDWTQVWASTTQDFVDKAAALPREGQHPFQAAKELCALIEKHDLETRTFVKSSRRWSIIALVGSILGAAVQLGALWWRLHS